MAIVSCPECGKKLKVADASVGKKVKCSCGNVFVAETETAVKKPVAAAAIAPEKVFVACTECDAKLKVPTTSLGKKMKCPKCASVFIADLPDEAPKKKATLELDEEDAKPVAKGKAKPKDDDMDDLLGFAMEDAAQDKNGSYDDEPPMKSKGKAKKPADEDEDDEPKPRGKAGKKPGKPPRRADDDDETAPVYPSRLFLNIVVVFMLLGYLAVLAGVFFFGDEYKIDAQALALVGIDKPKLKKGIVPVIPNKKDPEQKLTPPPAFDLAARQKEEKSWLDKYRAGVRPDVPNVVAILQPNENVVGVAFSPASPVLAAVSMVEGIKFWDLTAAKPTMKPIALDLKGDRPMIAFSPGGDLLAIASFPDQFLKVWKVADGSIVKQIKLAKTPEYLAFSSDGKYLTVLARDHLGEKPFGGSWTVADWKEHRPDVDLAAPGEHLLSPDGNKLLSIDPTGKVKIQEIATSANKVLDLKKVIRPHARLSPDGKYLAHSHPDKEDAHHLELIELDAGAVKVVTEEKHEIDRIQFSPDSKFVLFEVANVPKLVEIDTKKMRWSMTTEIDAIAFSPGGVFVARSKEGSIHLLALDEMLASEPKTPEVKKKTTEPKVAVEGAWKLESAEQDGKPIKDLVGERFDITADKFSGAGDTDPYVLDDSKTPRWITIKGPKGEDHLTGIYKLDGDALTLCFATPDKEEKPRKRPTKFDSAQGMVMVLKRLSKEEAKVAQFNHRQSQNNLKNLGLGVHTFHDANKVMPTDILDPAGKPLLSWRVAILPFLDQGPLYEAFDLTKPWDDPHNKKLIADMPQFYVVPGTDGKTGKTHYRSFAGKDTPFEPKVKRTLAGITDGTSNVIMIFEAKDAVEWTRPDDLPLDPKGPLPKLGVAPDGFNVAFGDATVRHIPLDISEKLLRPFLTCNNNTPRSPDDLEKGAKKKVDEKKVDDGKINHRQSQINLKVMVLGAHGFHDAMKHFPVGISDPDGKPLLSWRVALLPYLDQGPLYKEFDLTKPWDDPQNKKLIAKMPAIYVVPGTDGKTGMTHYRGLTGPRTMFEKLLDGKLAYKKLVNITDGTSNVIMIVEAKAPVEWTKPEELSFDPEGPLPKFGVAPDGFNVALVDGSARFVPANVSDKVLRPYLTCDNGIPRAPLDVEKGGKEKDPKDKDDFKNKSETKLEGAWKIESAEIRGKALKHLVGERYVIADGKVSSADGDPAYTLDNGKTPHWITWASTKVTIHGIYKVEGDTLTWCLVPPDKEGNAGVRPTKFDSSQGMLMVLKRLSKDEAKVAQFNHRQSQINLKFMAIGVHTFADDNKRLPADILDPAGKPLLSWRVAILPFLDRDDLHKEFDLTKPWNDPHNQKLIAKMPAVYVVPGTDDKAGKTHYRSFAGPDTPFEPKVKRNFVGITDGTSNVIMIVEAKDAIEWTRPDDLPLDPKGALPKLGVAPDGFNVAFGDATVRLIPHDVSEKLLRPFLTCNNKTARSPDDLDKGGKGKDDGKKKVDDEKDKKKDETSDATLVKTIQALGGQAVRDEKLPGSPVVEVSLQFTKFVDADVKTLAVFKQLRKLTLGLTKVSDVGLTDLAPLENLEFLDLTSSPVTDAGMKELAGLTKLKTLTLGNSKVKDAGLKELVKLNQLQSLNVSQLMITDAGLKALLVELKQLQNLDISNTQAGDESLTALAGFEQVQVLILFGSKVSDKGMASLSAHKQLKELHASYQVTDDGLKSLAGLKELQVLSLFNTRVTNAGLKELAGLSKLEKLDLKRTAISDVGLKELAGMKQLQSLNLEGAKVTDAGLKDLRGLKGLQQLHLGDLPITDAGLKELTGLTELRSLDLYNTKVSAEGIAELRKALPKCGISK